MNWELSSDSEGAGEGGHIADGWSLSESDESQDRPPQPLPANARPRGRPRKVVVEALVAVEPLAGENIAVAQPAWHLLARPIGDTFYQRCSGILALAPRLFKNNRKSMAEKV